MRESFLSIRKGLNGEYKVVQLPLLFLLMIISTIVVVPLGCVAYMLLTGIPVEQFLSILTSNAEVPEWIDVMKFMNTIQAVALFIVPSIIFAALLSGKPSEYLKFRAVNRRSVMIVVILFLAALPMIQFFAVINSKVQLPEFMSGVESIIRAMEDSAMEITNKFLVMDSLSDMFINILIIAIIPAIGEELLFRGVIQKMVTRWCGGNYHKGVWIAAIIFSAFHMQFYGFIPRMLLGAILGYSLVLGGSIWYPIIGHFINNGVAVITAYFMGVDSEIGDQSSPYFYIVLGAISILCCLFIVKLLKRLHLENREKSTDLELNV